MTEPFRNTILYRMLKSGGYWGTRILGEIEHMDTAGNRRYREGEPNILFPNNPDMNTDQHPHTPTWGNFALGTLRDVSNLANNTTRSTYRGVRNVEQRARGFAEDAGESLGTVIGDMFGKLNTKPSPYEDADIISLLKEKEEIQVLNRETERLRRIARIQARKKKKIKEMTEQALRSPYI